MHNIDFAFSRSIKDFFSNMADELLPILKRIIDKDKNEFMDKFWEFEKNKDNPQQYIIADANGNNNRTLIFGNEDVKDSIEELKKIVPEKFDVAAACKYLRFFLFDKNTALFNAENEEDFKKEARTFSANLNQLRNAQSHANGENVENKFFEYFENCLTSLKAIIDNESKFQDFDAYINIFTEIYNVCFDFGKSLCLKSEEFAARKKINKLFGLGKINLNYQEIIHPAYLFRDYLIVMDFSALKTDNAFHHELFNLTTKDIKCKTIIMQKTIDAQSSKRSIDQKNESETDTTRKDNNKYIISYFISEETGSKKILQNVIVLNYKNEDYLTDYKQIVAFLNEVALNSELEKTPNINKEFFEKKIFIVTSPDKENYYFENIREKDRVVIATATSKSGYKIYQPPNPPRFNVSYVDNGTQKATDEEAVSSFVISTTPNEQQSYTHTHPQEQEKHLTTLPQNEGNSQAQEKSDDICDEFYSSASAKNLPSTLQPNCYTCEKKDSKLKIKLAGEISEGGEGKLFAIEDNSRIAKVYFSNNQNENKNKKIWEMVKISADNNFFNDIVVDHKICWPLSAVLDCNGKRIVGYTMLRAKNAITIEELIKSIKEKLKNGNSLKSVEINIGSKEIEITRKWLTELCEKIAAKFDVLHNIGKPKVLMGDVSPSNIMVDENGEVWFIDCDSYQLSYDDEGQVYKCPVGKPDWSSDQIYKEIKNEGKSFADIVRTFEDERFACAILYYYILTLGDFPFIVKTDKNSKYYRLFKYNDESFDTNMKTRNYIWLNMPEDVKGFFRNAFSNPEKYSPWPENQKSDDKHSDWLIPTTYTKEDNDAFIDTKCKECKKELQITKSFRDNNLRGNEKSAICADCQDKITIAKATIYTCICSECNKRFTINRYTAFKMVGQKIDVENKSIICPDCAEKKTENSGNKNSIDETGLKKQIFYILKNLKNGE